jgi:hypothetical protein
MQEQADTVSGALDVTRPRAALAEPQPFYRLEISEHADGTIELLHASLVIMDHFPQSAAAADYMLVSRDAAGSLLDVVPLFFERAGHSSSFEQGQFVHEELTLDSAVTSTFIPAAAGLSRIEVLDVGMNLQLGLDAASLPSTEEPEDEANADPVPKAAGTSLTARFKGLTVLKPGQESRVPVPILTTAKIVSLPGATTMWHRSIRIRSCSATRTCSECGPAAAGSCS